MVGKDNIRKTISCGKMEREEEQRYYKFMSSSWPLHALTFHHSMLQWFKRLFFSLVALLKCSENGQNHMELSSI